MSGYRERRVWQFTIGCNEYEVSRLMGTQAIVGLRRTVGLVELDIETREWHWKSRRDQKAFVDAEGQDTADAIVRYLNENKHPELP